MTFAKIYSANVERRRALRLAGYATLADVGFDGPWVSPYQKASCAETGPVLIAYNWLDAPSVKIHRETLSKLGYLPSIQFNRVLDLALRYAGLRRSDLYVTQAFHLLPGARSATIPPKAVDLSFESVTKHEIVGRKVIALGDVAINACARHGVKCIPTCHPSARGRSYEDKAKEIASALCN